jgi:hypothetical protein
MMENLYKLLVVADEVTTNSMHHDFLRCTNKTGKKKGLKMKGLYVQLTHLHSWQFFALAAQLEHIILHPRLKEDGTWSERPGHTLE